MAQIKYLCTLISILLFLMESAHAKMLDLSGKWIWLTPNDALDVHVFQLSQHNTALEASINTYCGHATVDGDINGARIGMKLHLNTSNENCPNSMQIIAHCANEECSIINGEWYDSNSYLGNLTWVKLSSNFYISNPEPLTNFIIDTQPAMPLISFTVSGVNNQEQLLWSLALNYNWLNGHTTATLANIISTTPYYTPVIDAWDILGGNLTTTVISQSLPATNKIATGNYTILGTNPGLNLIKHAITDPTLYKIACVESAYRQFSAKREHGVGLPLIGLNANKEQIGGIGIMQVLNEKIIPKTVWDWRANIANGLEILNYKRTLAKHLHINERLRLNAERKNLGLPICPTNTPPPLTAEQINREAIRRYNYGVEYRWEPRDAMNCAGQWVISPTCVRHPENGCDPNYVNKVIACNLN